MNHHNTQSTPSVSSIGIFVLLLLVLFAADLAQTELFCPLHVDFPPLAAGLFDALLLPLLFAVPLWIFFVRPLSVLQASPGTSSKRAMAALVGKVLALLFITDFLSITLLGDHLPCANDEISDLAEAGLTALLGAPVLWWLLFRRGLCRPWVPLAEGLGTPFGLYSLLLFLVFFSDLLQELLLPLFLPDALHLSYKLVDSLVSTLFIAPFFWFLVARPLQRTLGSEKILSGAIHSQIIDAIVTIDGEGRIETFNAAAERIFNYSSADLLGQPVDLLLADGPPGFYALKERAARMPFTVGVPMIHEVMGKRRDGTTLTLEVSLSPIRMEQRSDYLLIMRDISGRKLMETALRQSKERFRQIFEQSEDAIIFFKPQSSTVLDANVTAEGLFGRSVEEFKMNGLEGICRAEDLVRLERAISRINSGETVELDHLICHRGDGSEFIVTMRGKVMTLQGIGLSYCTFREVTDRIRMEMEGREIQAKLIQANKMTSLGLLVSGVAHEINNPNNFIMANSRLLARSWDDALKILREYADENGEFFLGGVPFAELDAHSPELFAGIFDGAQRINAIVNNLKSFARQDQTVAESRFDLNQVATSAITILHHELVRYTERFQTELKGDLPLVQGSAQQVAQVIINLLMNACQALPERSRGIWLGTYLEPLTGDVVVEVRDEGSGMGPEAARRIMEPFFTTKLDSGGTGLGLSICQSIVREHRGRLEFTSEPGRGSTFRVQLPAVVEKKDSLPCPK